MTSLLGAAAWLVAMLLLPLTAIESLFLWGSLVVMPLALEAIPTPRWLRRIQPAAAILAVVSFAFPPGTKAAIWAAPWAAMCLALALFGAARFFRRRWDPVETIIDAGRGLIAVGGWGLVMSRAGLKPSGFEEPIVLLTAVHFHYTAFVAPLLIGLAGRREGPRASLVISGAAVVLATPALAAGFVLRLPLLKIAAVGAIAAGMILFAGRLARISEDEPRGGSRALLGIASFSIFWGMVMAALYSFGEFRESPLVSIPAMSWSHGILNAFGFATCGLLGARAWRA